MRDEKISDRAQGQGRRQRSEAGDRSTGEGEGGKGRRGEREKGRIVIVQRSRCTAAPVGSRLLPQHPTHSLHARSGFAFGCAVTGCVHHGTSPVGNALTGIMPVLVPAKRPTRSRMGQPSRLPGGREIRNSKSEIRNATARRREDPFSPPLLSPQLGGREFLTPHSSLLIPNSSFGSKARKVPAHHLRFGHFLQ
jgi:hypothetical protein